MGYCMVVLGTTGYWVVLGCTGGELVGTEGSGGFWGTVWYQRVLWRTIQYWDYWVVQGVHGSTGSKRGYSGVLEKKGDTVEYCGPSTSI